MPRKGVTRFDWEDCRKRRAQGESLKALAERYGVSTPAIRAVHGSSYDACGGCGGPMRKGQRRCQTCYEAERSSVRAATLRCSTCQQWKPDAEFATSPSQAKRRGRTRECRVCDAARHRKLRRRQREAVAT